VPLPELMTLAKTVVPLVLFAILLPAFGQKKRVASQPAAALTHPAAIPKSVLDAEEAIAKKDYARAESLLTEATAREPKDHRAWYDLGFVLKVTDRLPEAVDAYRKSLALKPDEAATNSALGELLVASGHSAEGILFLAKAAKLNPSAANWMLLGESLAASDPAAAVDAYRSAVAASPKDIEPHLRAGAVLEAQKRYSEAEVSYRSALALDAKSAEALAGLTNVYIATDRVAEAESALRKYLVLDPSSAQARIQLGRLLARSGRADEAIAELESGIGDPSDPKLARELAGLYLAAKKFDSAVPAFQSLLPALADDATVHYGLGSALLQLTRYPEAESALLQAVKLDPRMAEAYANLALAASNNKHYELAIRALDAHAALAADNPATYFLRATCYDNLKLYKEAAKNYRLFLQVAGGRFADQEWQAKHRLIAIEPKRNR
jgi:Flp pilus assembly protein TadD